MSHRNPDPCAPEFLDLVLRDIRATTREEWIERLSRYPDWNPAWAEPESPAPEQTNGARAASVGEDQLASLK